MGLWNYLVGKVIARPEVVEPAVNGFNTLKIVSVSGSVALVLFGLGYAFYGMGQVMKPVSEIIDELHDSDSDSDTDTSSKRSASLQDIKIENEQELDEILSDENLSGADDNSDDELQFIPEDERDM